MKRYGIFKRLLDWPAGRPRVKGDRWRVDVVLASDCAQEIKALEAEKEGLLELLRGVSDGKCGNIRPYGPKEIKFTKRIYDMFALEAPHE